jgi:hypothetical protein
MKAVTFCKVTTGEFDVLVDGAKSGYTITNGSRGLSGQTENVYGIIKPGGSVRWIGTLQACKKVLRFTLAGVK